jgi:nitronate monooxygenase
MAASMRTWLTDRFELSVPVVCAPMFGVAGGRLAGAVSRAGGLGMIGVGSTTTAAQVTDECQVAAAAGKPYGVGLMAWALANDRSPFDATLAATPALVSIGFGDYEQYVGPLQAAGVVVATQAGTLAEAKVAEQAGVDAIVARGSEGGGHGRNDVATLPLLQVVLDAVNTPVLAAGGIANARGLAAVLAAGAAGAWVGTAFLVCEEAETAPGARERLLSATDTDTAYGRVFDVAQRLGWPPEFGGRALRNLFFEQWAGREEELATDDDAQEVLRAARTAGDYDASYIYTGQGAALLHEQHSAAEVIDEFSHAADLLASAANPRQAQP